MSDIKFTEDHEWIRMDDAETASCGISDYAQEQLGELVFVELPEVGQEVTQGNETAVIESVKAAGEFKAPVSGTIVAVNEALADEPETVNNNPLGDGWFIKIKLSDPSELDGLMDESTYESYVEGID